MQQMSQQIKEKTYIPNKTPVAVIILYMLNIKIMTLEIDETIQDARDMNDS